MKSQINFLLLAMLFVTYAHDLRSQHSHFSHASAKHIRLSTGIDMYYREIGKPGNEEMIMLHGVTDTSWSFRSTVDSLLTLFPDLHIIIPDLRGHGRSSMPSPEHCAADPAACFEISDFAADLIAFMDQANIKKAHLVGHSLGSMVAQVAALEHPERVNSVTLISTSTDLRNNPVVQYLYNEVVMGMWKKVLERKIDFQWPRDAYVLTPLDVDVNAEEWMAANWAADPTAVPQFIKPIAADAARVRLGTWYGFFRAIQTFNTTQALEDISVPTLVLWARQDNMFFEDPDQKKLCTALARAGRNNQIPYFFKAYGKLPLPDSHNQENDYGHNLQWGAPQGVASDLASFIRTGKPTSDLYYADPQHLTAQRVDPGQAAIITNDASQ